MNVSRLLLYYALLSVVRLKNGSRFSDNHSGIVKRTLAFHKLKKECARMATMMALAEERKKRKKPKRKFLRGHDTKGAWNSLVPELRNYDRKGFFNFFRMTPECFDWLLSKVRPLLKNRKRGSISKGERLAVTLRFLASGDSQVSLSYLFRIADVTISRIIRETSYAIYRALEEIVFEPITPDFWRQRAAEFESMWNFPMCIGAIDGKHVFTQKFNRRGSENYCFKDMNSVILLAVCDAKYRFIAVDVGAPGREHDAGVFAASEFGILFENGELNIPPDVYREDLQMSLPYTFVGDDAFTLGPHLLKPFDGFVAEDDTKVIFNYRLSRARRVVENAFGILASRFRLFRRPIIGSETMTVNCILAATALHNLLLSREDCIPPGQRIDAPPEPPMYKKNGRVKRSRYRNENKILQGSLFHKLCQQAPSRDETEHGHEVRAKFSTLFLADPIPWQWNVLHWA